MYSNNIQQRNQQHYRVYSNMTRDWFQLLIKIKMNFIYLLNSQSIIHRQSESQSLTLVDCSSALLTSGMISSMSPLIMISSISSGFLLISSMTMISLIVLFISILLLLPFGQMTELAGSVALSLRVQFCLKIVPLRLWSECWLVLSNPQWMLTRIICCRSKQWLREYRDPHSLPSHYRIVNLVSAKFLPSTLVQ